MDIFPATKIFPCAAESRISGCLPREIHAMLLASLVSDVALKMVMVITKSFGLAEPAWHWSRRIVTFLPTKSKKKPAGGD